MTHWDKDHIKFIAKENLSIEFVTQFSIDKKANEPIWV